MDSQKTVFSTPNLNSQFNSNSGPVKKQSKAPIIFLIFAVIALGSALIYYFAIFKSDPKFVINYTTDGGIESKGNSIFELLYNNPGNIIIEIEASKIPSSKQYLLTVNGVQEPVNFESQDNKIKFKKSISPNGALNSQIPIMLTDNQGKVIYNNNFSISVLRPTMSSREFVENYLRSYSDAFSSQSSTKLYNATSYWETGKTDLIYEKVKFGFPNKEYYYFDNVIGMSNDDVSAKVSITKYNESNSTTYSYAYLFKLKVVKGSNGIPEWKISEANERVEKKDTYNFNDFEGD